MLPTSVDTIVAIATAQGCGGIGVVRLSGEAVPEITKKLLGDLPKPRFARYSSFLDAQGALIDRGIALYFAAPYSYTGEHVLELQGHGSPAGLQLLVQRCMELGARLAEPGEFTRRAFLNNKMDLAQAESVADLIEATTAEAVRSAMRSLQGEFSVAIHDLVDQLISLRILVEAMLDFPEEDIQAIDTKRRDTLLQQIQVRLSGTQQRVKQGSLLREGAHIVLAGRPNVGKSSLLNQFAGEEAALVSDIPGTTRDVIRQHIQIRGVPLHIIDTAGLRDSQDVVENMGINRTHQTLKQADLILLLMEASNGATEEDKNILKDIPTNIPKLLVFNKSDLLGAKQGPLSKNEIFISAKTGDGIERLKDKILELIGWRNQEGGVFMARTRHLQALNQAQVHLVRAETIKYNAELFSEELRLMQLALGNITGEFAADDLLGEIFSRFCIGK